MKLAILCAFSLAASTLAALPRKFSQDVLLQAWDASDNMYPNIVVSPFSLLPPLGSLILGSRGSTANEILNVLQLRDLNQVTKEYTTSIQTLEALDNVEIDIANRLYIAVRSTINHSFRYASQKYFDLDVTPLDFSYQQYAANQINFWVRNQTENRIKNLVQPSSLSRATRALFVNTVYFEADWKTPFNRRRNFAFYPSDNTTSYVDGMHARGYFYYSHSRNLNSEIISIPYKNEKCAFTIVLPSMATSDLKELTSKLARNPNLINIEIIDLKETLLELTMPKFEFELKTNLKEVLTKMNVRKIFSYNSELNNVLLHETLIIDEAYQKAYIKVNEQGTIAAAANVFGGLSSGPTLRPIFPQIRVNRPFYYEIRCSTILLFNGVVNKPLQ